MAVVVGFQVILDNGGSGRDGLIKNGMIIGWLNNWL